MDRSWKTVEMHDRKSQYCLEWIIKGVSSENSERKETCGGSLKLLREYLSKPEKY